MNNLVETIQNMDGNYLRKAGDLYISPVNIEKIPILLDSCDNIQSILITPFLINTETDAVYELHYYEFDIEVSDVSKSRYVEYPQENILPKEITENINPKAIVAKDDKNFFIASLRKYLMAMQKMSFDSDKNLIPFLNNCKLCFQIY